MVLDRRRARCVAWLGLLLCTSWIQPARAQTASLPDSKMAALEAYLMPRDAEIALARSAGPADISRDATIFVLERGGYEMAARGSNGFVCAVERSWMAGTDDPDFWNAKIRGPVCFNAAAARTQVPILLKRTELIMTSHSKEQMERGLDAAFAHKKLREPEPGSMSFMLSRQQDLGRNGTWHPHLMFFVPLSDPDAWAANLKGSPVMGAKDAPDRLTIFFVPVTRWSDGTAAPLM